MFEPHILMQNYEHMCSVGHGCYVLCRINYPLRQIPVNDIRRSKPKQLK